MLKNRKKDDGKVCSGKNTILVCGNRFPDHHTIIPMLIFYSKKNENNVGNLINKNFLLFFIKIKTKFLKNKLNLIYVLFIELVKLITLKLCSTDEI